MIVSRTFWLAELTGLRALPAHQVPARSVGDASRGPSAPSAISAEACPHHFTLTDRPLPAATRSGARTAKASRVRLGRTAEARVAGVRHAIQDESPLRSAAGDRAALIEGLADGTLDVIASDHAPHCDYEKKSSSTTRPSASQGWRRNWPCR